MYLLGQYKKIDGYEEEMFIPYEGLFCQCDQNCSECEQDLVDLKKIIGDDNLKIIKLGPPQTIDLDLTQVKDIKVIE